MLQQVAMSNGLSVNFASNVKQLHKPRPGHSIYFLNRIWFCVLQHDQFFPCLRRFSNLTQFAFAFWIVCATCNISELKWTCKNMKVRWIFHSLHSTRLFFSWDSLHTRLNSYYEAWSYKKKKHKKIKAYRKSV